MLDQRRVAAQPDEKREQLFTERYEDLLAWAMRLTNQQRESAEDLVQDAFVQFMLGRTRLEEIENIDGYLRRMLRYMHVSRFSRPAQQLHETAISVADYDSFRLGWTAVEAPRRLQASEELHQICMYACLRKESSKAGSVLILRFFHDFFPTEVAGVLNSSRHCVDQWQRLARQEAKLFMNEPGRLRFVNAKTQAGQGRVRYIRSDRDLMLELRQMIFKSRKGDCLSPQELEQAYANGNADPLTTQKLAHIVSCPSCLDAVNRLLGLPLLEERYQTERSQPNEPPRDATGGGTSGGGSTHLPKKFGQRLRETLEHKPHELRIAVNGFLVGSLKVSSELCELNLNLTPEGPVEFVEVSSEQGVQLLFFSVDADGPHYEQWAWIELSDGRSLEACFKNDSKPNLQVVYKDPLPEAYQSVETLNTNTLSSPLFVVPHVEELDESNVARHGLGFRLSSRTRRVLGLLKVLLRRPIVAAETSTQFKKDALSTFDQQTSQTPFLTLQAEPRPTWPLGLFIAFVSAAVVAGFLFFRASLSPALTATALLDRASVVEQASEVPDKVRHRLINLEERRSAEGAIVTRRKIEVWENRAKGDRAQRLFDDSNQLIAGVWQTASGSRNIYHHGSKPRSQPAPATPDNLLLNFDDIWQVEPSAQAFRDLVAGTADVNVEERSTTYVLRYERERMIGASRLLKATVTLSKSESRALEQTLLVQRGDELREYRFVEASFELLPAKDVAPAVFEIEPELTGGAGETGRPGAWALRGLTSSRVPPSLSTSAPPIASAELEVDVAYLLNRAKADRNEQVALTRSAGGSLRVEGVVESQQRKEEFLKALAPVINNPAVKIEIHTVAEAMQGRISNAPIPVQETVETSQTVAADQELRTYFDKKDPDGPTDEAIRTYSSRVVNRAYRALFHAIELKRLVNRFANVDMRSVAPDARAKWIAMLLEHATAFERDNAMLRQEIQPVFFPRSTFEVAEEGSIKSDSELAGVVERLHKSALFNNDAIRSAFTISAQSSAATIKSAAFWSSLQRAESLAQRIRRYQAPSN